MEDFRKNDCVSRDIGDSAEFDREDREGEEPEDEVTGFELGIGDAKASRFWEKVREKAPRITIFARYLLPAVFGIVLFAVSFLDGVYFYMNGRTMKMSLFAFYKNTLTAAHNYLAGATEAQTNWFYGLLSGGAIVFALCYLLAIFLTVLAAITACRAFFAKPEGELCNRMKVIFKIAFPNRILLYLSDLLLLVPTLYPEYFSAVGRRFLLIGGKETVYVKTNIYLIVTAVFLGLMAVLSFLIVKWERQKNMNMFLITHSESGESEAEDE